jgi:type IV secretory pathway ATPase VirB11/archaellum biosynthesis ATPase
MENDKFLNYIRISKNLLASTNDASLIGKDNSILPNVSVLRKKDGTIIFDFSKEYAFLNDPVYEKLVEKIRDIELTTLYKFFKEFFKEDFGKYDKEPKELSDNPELIEIRNQKLASLFELVLQKKKAYSKLYNELLKKYPNSNFLRNIKLFSMLLVYEFYEFGLLSFFFRSDEVEEIYIGSAIEKSKSISIYLDHRKYSRVLTNLTFTSKNEFMKFVKSAGSFLSRVPSESNPLVNTKIPYGRGGRAQITIKPSALENVGYVNIRLFPHSPFNIVKIIEWNSIPSIVIPYFVSLFETKGNTMVCGETGSGKTTLLNALMGFAPINLRTIIVEETPEIILEGFRLVVKIVATEEAPLQELISASLRQTPQIYILGEVRTSEEIQGYLRTTSAGQANLSIATFHASSVEGFIERLKKEGNASLPQVKTIDVIVFQNKLNVRKDGRDVIMRKVTGVYELIKNIDEELYLMIIDYFKKRYKLENKSIKEIMEFITETVKALGSFDITMSINNEPLRIKMVNIEGEILYFLTILEYDLGKDTFLFYKGSLRKSQIIKNFMKKLKIDNFDIFYQSKYLLIQKIVEIYKQKGLAKESFKKFVLQWNVDRNKIYG